MQVTQVAMIGECMVELQRQGNLFKQNFGGDTLNTAVYFSYLTQKHNIQTRYITGLGKDYFSHSMLTEWQDKGIVTDLVTISDKHLPGIYMIETQANGERVFFYWRDNSAAKYWLTEDNYHQIATRLNQQKFIYLSGISLAILSPDRRERLLALLSQARNYGAKVIFDNNYRPNLWDSAATAKQIYLQILAITDIAFITFDDDALLFADTHAQQSLARAQQQGVSEIIIKRGALPCLVVENDRLIEVSANKIEHVVDTTAAGDSFSGGYLACRILGGTPEMSAAYGHRLAGTVIQYPGAIIPLNAIPPLILSHE